MKCEDCCFFWRDEDENHPYCHFESRWPDDKAPCDREDDSYEEEAW